MILLNVLSLVALASTIVMLMIAGQDGGVQRSLRFREAGQAAAIARAGELSAIVALRRDAVEAPLTDHLREPWAAIVEKDAAIAGGRFSLSVTDAQARFNLSDLAGTGASPIAPIVAGLKLDPQLIERISAFVRQQGKAPSVSQLLQLGVDPGTMATLTPLVTVLPEPTTVNLNTASEALIALLVGDPAIAAALVEQRRRIGFLTSEDFGRLRVFTPPGTGFTSNYYWVRTTVTIGDTSQTLVSLLGRRNSNGSPEVSVYGRWRGTAAPDRTPPLL